MKAQRFFFIVTFLSLPALIFYNVAKILDRKADWRAKQLEIQEIEKRFNLRQLFNEGLWNQSKKTVQTERIERSGSGELEVIENQDQNVFLAQIQTINKLLEPIIHKEFNCTKLFDGDQDEQEKVKTFHKKFPYKHVPESSFLKATKDCAAYIKARGYVAEASSEEADFPLAYSLTIHKHVDQFERLLRAIYRPNNYYCVHVDRKSGQKFHDAVNAIAECFDNVFVASKLEVVVYGGFTRLQADINCMEDLWEKFSDWHYVLNMAGTEMPLKSNRELVYLLKLYGGKNVIGKNHKILPSRWKKRYQTKVVNMTGSIKVVNKTNAKPPFNLTMIKGSAYAIFSRALVDYAIHDPLPIKFLEWCSHTYSPDEHYWTTLNDLRANPHLKTPGGNDSPGNIFITRAVLWNSPLCMGKNVHKVCQYGVKNLPWLKERNEFVANKFDFETDFTAFDCMEELIAQRSQNSEPWDLQYQTDFINKHSIAKNTS